MPQKEIQRDKVFFDSRGMYTETGVSCSLCLSAKPIYTSLLCYITLADHHLNFGFGFRREMLHIESEPLFRSTGSLQEELHFSLPFSKTGRDKKKTSTRYSLHYLLVFSFSLLQEQRITLQKKGMKIEDSWDTQIKQENSVEKNR